MFMILFEYLKVRLSLSVDLFKILLAKIYVKPIKKVAVNFNTKKATMLVLTIPVKKGFNSAAPKYKTPITVVTQSIEPNRIINKLGNKSAFKLYIEAFSLSFASSFFLKRSLLSGLKNKIAKFDIFQ